MSVNIFKSKERVTIGEDVFTVQPDPIEEMNHKPYIELGGSGLVVKLSRESTDKQFALKIFNNPNPRILENQKHIVENGIVKLPGMDVAHRVVINPKEKKYFTLIKKYPFLEYAILMPWIDGFSWMQILMDNKEAETKSLEFSKETSLYYAFQISKTLAAIEGLGSAHCDICSGNVILDFRGFAAQIIDIEDMYFSNASRDRDFFGGQAGYTHPQSLLGHQWVKEGDRFGGGMLISELLAWYSPSIRDASASESFAEPEELCSDKRKYNLMMDALVSYNAGFESLFQRLWNSKNVSDCPELSDWKHKINYLVDKMGSLMPQSDYIEKKGKSLIERAPTDLKEDVNSETNIVIRKKVYISNPLEDL